MRVVWTDEAKGDLTEQIRYIAARDPGAARRLRSRVHQAISQLRHTPRLGRPGTIEGTRELVIASTSYVAQYGIVGDTIEVYHLHHGRQNWREAAE